MIGVIDRLFNLIKYNVIKTYITLGHVFFLFYADFFIG